MSSIINTHNSIKCCINADFVLPVYTCIQIVQLLICRGGECYKETSLKNNNFIIRLLFLLFITKLTSDYFYFAMHSIHLCCYFGTRCKALKTKCLMPHCQRCGWVLLCTPKYAILT